MTNQGSGRNSSRRRSSAPRVPQQEPAGKKQGSIWDKLAIPLVVVVAILAMAAIPAWGYIQTTFIPGQEELANVRGTTISMNDLVRRMRYERAILEQRQAQPEEFASVPMQAVFDLVDQELIRQGAEAAGVRPTPDDIADEKLAIARQGLSGEAWSDIATARATRKAFERYLNLNLPNRSPQVRLEGFTTGSERDAQTAIQRLNEGATMRELATSELSYLPRFRTSGGEIGWMPPGLVNDRFDDAVFAAPVGAIVGPIDSFDGYYVVRVLEKAEDRLIDAAPYRELQAASLRKWLDDQRTQQNAIALSWDSDKYAWANDQVRR